MPMPPRLGNDVIQKWVEGLKKSGGLDLALVNMKETLVFQTKHRHPNAEFQSITVDNANRIFKMLLIAKSHGFECFDDAP